MKLLFAEDTKDLSRAVCAVLTHEGYDVDPVFDGAQALEHLALDSYDCIILDIMMPNTDGLEALRVLRSRNILTPVLMLTAKAEVDDRVNGLDAGADDYLTKPFAMKELLARVRALTRRKNDYSGNDLHYHDVSLHAGTLELSCENSVRLSIKEFELLQTLIMNAGRSLPTEYLLSHVWADEPAAVSDTVWLYISYLNGKLRAVSSAVTIIGERGGAFTLQEGAVR